MSADISDSESHQRAGRARIEFAVSVETGSNVLPSITDRAFATEWQQVAKEDRKFTVLQEPAFVVSWYRQHEPLFEPVVCLGRGAGGRLVGVMALARSRVTGAMTHAGDFHADYHGWTALPEVDDLFPVECLIVLKRTFALREWGWNWLPPGTSTAFLSARSLAENRIFVTSRTAPSPVWNLEDAERLSELSKTKSIRNQINRFKKRGDFTLERVRDKKRTRDLMGVLRAQCDFRQEVTQGIRPFADNPCKEPFFVGRQDFPEANHFTVLWSAGRPVSFHFGACSKGTLLLGLTAYDPTESRNSPGKVHLIELARMLGEEGIRRIDLTPGGDQYKEFIANESQDLTIPTFYFSRTAKVLAETRGLLRKAAKELLALTPIRPAALSAAVSRLRDLPARLRSVTTRKLVRRIMRIFCEDIVYRQYSIRCSHEPAAGARDPEVSVQRYEDLLAYPHPSPRDRRTMLSDAMKRFASGETLYSVARGGQLLHYGWIARGGQTHFLQGVNVSFDSPADSAVLYDFFTHPGFRGQGLYQRNLRQMLRDLAESGVQRAFIGVLEGNDSSRRAIEKIGFSLHRVYRRRRILWMEKREEHA